MAISLRITILSIFVTFLSLLPILAISDQTYSTFNKIQMPPGDTGPVTIAFPPDSFIFTFFFGSGPYIAVADGRILRWAGSTDGFVDFAYTSPQRSKKQCDGSTDPELESICGRPLAISFSYWTLYIADAYFGLSKVSIWGGLAKSIATSSNDVPFKLLMGVDADAKTGTVYFSDATNTFSLRDFERGQYTNSLTGKFMKYNPWTREVTDLVKGLSGGGSPAVSRDGSYVLFPEYFTGSVNKYWISGPKANTVERNLLSVDGIAHEINHAEREGEYWLAVELIQKTKADDGSTIVTSVPQGWRIDGDGKVLQKVSFEAEFKNVSVSVIQERHGALHVGSRFTDFIGVYTN